jgi:hypothetical protein
MDEDLREMVRGSVRQALATSPADVATALAEFGWAELAAEEESFAYVTLFETQGALGADTDALDVAVAVAGLGDDRPIRVLWPLSSPATAPATAGDAVVVTGVALRPTAGFTVAAPVGGRLVEIRPSAVVETPAGGMAAECAWVRVEVEGAVGDDLAAWDDVERRAWLATASELVGISQRILDVAVEQVSERRQFGQPIAVNQAVRHKLAEAYAETVGARAVVARAWEDGTPTAAAWARAVAANSVDSVGKHAMQVCGAIGLSAEHAVPQLVKRAFALDALLRPTVVAPLGGRFLAGEAVEPLGGF